MQNGAFVTPHFEPTKSLEKVLKDDKSNGGEVIERGLDKLHEWAETINPWKISKLIWNSLENNYNEVKSNRLDGENLSIKEAENLLTKSWKNLNKRIMVGIDKEGNLILEDGRHLLEAYRKLWKEIPLEKLWFVNDEARSLFNTLYSKA